MSILSATISAFGRIRTCVAAFTLCAAFLLMGGYAGAASAEGAATSPGATSDPDSIYKPTPAGSESIPYGNAPNGPDHLRRISPTEALPAEPQIEKVIDVPSYGVSAPSR